METKSTHLLFLVLHLLLAGVDDLVVVGGVLVTHLEGLGRAEISPLPFSTSLLKMASKFIEVLWNREGRSRPSCRTGRRRRGRRCKCRSFHSKDMPGPPGCHRPAQTAGPDENIAEFIPGITQPPLRGFSLFPSAFVPSCCCCVLRLLRARRSLN